MVNTRKGGLLEPAVTIRPFVVGRKNYLFSQSIRGVRANANPYSLIETAKEHGIGRLPIWSKSSKDFLPLQQSRVLPPPSNDASIFR